MIRPLAASCCALLLVPTLGKAQVASDPASQVRTDGLYHTCVYSNPADPQNPICTYVRFYPDGSGLTIMSADKPEQVNRWLTRENRTGDQGSYRVSGRTLTLEVPIANGTRTYQGEISSDGWVLGSRKYAFSPAGSANEPAPGQNRMPLVVAAISVENRIALGPTGRQEALTTTVSVSASDPDGDPLTFTWKASNGSINPSGGRVVWRRPVEFGRALEGMLVLEVQDDKGNKTTRAWLMN